jgi:hypothetical protein
VTSREKNDRDVTGKNNRDVTGESYREVNLDFRNVKAEENKRSESNEYESVEKSRMARRSWEEESLGNSLYKYNLFEVSYL